MYNPNLHFHFTGIGGSGMSGIAEILLRSGFRVSGSDLKYTPVCAHLAELGAQIVEGHSGDNLPESCSLLVRSTAVKMDNPEVREAQNRGIPIVRRAEVLAELMRLKFGVAVAGSHGKTTTTSLVATVLEAGGLDPTVIIGGQVKSIGSGGKLGQGDFLVAESDESDRSFLLLKPTIAVVTNIDAEHLEAYSSLQDLEESFEKFVKSVPFYGLAVLCADDPRLRDLAMAYRGRCCTYGLSPEANIRAINIESCRGGIRAEIIQAGESLGMLSLPLPGKHILTNSLAAVAVGLEFGISPDVILESLANFSGVSRRLERVGEVNGITVINDYGHHPTEIRATLGAAREGWLGTNGKLHVIFQPHRFSRTRDCFSEFLDCFKESDNLVVTSIHAAGEQAIEGISGERLCDAITHPRKHHVENPDDVLPGICKDLNSGDVVICLGAGSIGSLAGKIVETLEQL